MKSYSPDRLLSFIFICLFLWGTSLHAQENPAGCEPVGIIPHGANQIHTDITGGATLLGQTAIIRQGLTVYAYRLDASGQPILVGQMPLPLGGTPHFATNGETLSISLHSYEAVNGSGSSFSSPLSQRTVHKFSLQDLAPLEGFIDERKQVLSPRLPFLGYGSIGLGAMHGIIGMMTIYVATTPRVVPLGCRDDFMFPPETLVFS